MLGNPKYKQGELVTFRFIIEDQVEEINGAIYVVDANGTAEQQEEVSYDIEAFFRGEIMLFKHIRESEVFPR